ncbi:MAG: LD-carboxypeptidase [Turicibacter sp.]|nr:LD-carboxypeptidase [Turicibacter sp.]
MASETLLAGEDFLKSLGYDVLIAPSCFEQDRYLAGTSDEARALDLMMLFAEDEIGAILNMRGGYGSNRLMPYITGFDFAKYAKPFIGYSDITYLHIYLNQHHRLITYHGPMVKDLLKNEPLTLDGYSKTFLAGEPLTLTGVRYLNPPNEVATGLSIGGNLTIVATTLGTAYEVDTRGKILFLEEVGEAPYSVDRLLMQLIYAGKIHDCVGIILGDFAGDDQAGLFETIKGILVPIGKPLAYGIPAGHTSPNLTIPLGALCVLDAAGERIVFE